MEKSHPDSILSALCASENGLRLFRPHCDWRLIAAGFSRWRWKLARSLGFRPIRAGSYRSIHFMCRMGSGEVFGKTVLKCALILRLRRLLSAVWEPPETWTDPATSRVTCTITDM